MGFMGTWSGEEKSCTDCGWRCSVSPKLCNHPDAWFRSVEVERTDKGACRGRFWSSINLKGEQYGTESRSSN